MSKISSIEKIPGFKPADVFEVGSFISTLPEINGLTFSVGDDDGAEKFEQGLAINLGVDIAEGHPILKRIARGKPLVIPAEVVVFDPPNEVVIRGKSRLGGACLSLVLKEDKKIKGTRINNTLEITHNLLTRAGEPIVGQHLKKFFPEYTRAYALNVEEILKNSS
jgi:hypothetical protein